jgi:hypothetical protein
VDDGSGEVTGFQPERETENLRNQAVMPGTRNAKKQRTQTAMSGGRRAIERDSGTRPRCLRGRMRDGRDERPMPSKYKRRDATEGQDQAPGRDEMTGTDQPTRRDKRRTQDIYFRMKG